MQEQGRTIEACVFFCLPDNLVLIQPLELCANRPEQNNRRNTLELLKFKPSKTRYLKSRQNLPQSARAQILDIIDSNF